MPTWQIGESGTEVPLDAQGRGEVTFTVTNTSAAQDRSVLTISALDGAAESWFTVEEPQRAVAPGDSVAYLAKVQVPPGTAAGTYAMQAVAYSADRDPGETSTTSRRVTMTVPEPKPPPKTPWWVFLIAALVILTVIGVILWLVLDGDDGLTNEEPPEITGTPEVLQNLTASPGTWSEDNDVLGFTFQWERCNADGEECEPIDGATLPAYQVGADDEGRTLRVEVGAAVVGAAEDGETTTTLAGEPAEAEVVEPEATAVSQPTQVVAPAPEPEPIEVPPVIGLTLSDAVDQLAPFFQVVALTAGPPSNQCDPTVESQDPSFGTLLAPGEQVTIVSQPRGGPLIFCIPEGIFDSPIILEDELVTQFPIAVLEDLQVQFETGGG